MVMVPVAIFWPVTAPLAMAAVVTAPPARAIWL